MSRSGRTADVSRLAVRLHRVLPPLPTTVIGSFPQPDWLVDREKLRSSLPPRVRARELWRVEEPFLGGVFFLPLQQELKTLTVLSGNTTQSCHDSCFSQFPVRKNAQRALSHQLQVIDVVTAGQRGTKIQKQPWRLLLPLFGNDLENHWVFIVFEVPERRRDAQQQQTFRATMQVRIFRG